MSAIIEHGQVLCQACGHVERLPLQSSEEPGLRIVCGSCGLVILEPIVNRLRDDPNFGGSGYARYLELRRIHHRRFLAEIFLLCICVAVACIAIAILSQFVEQ